jgi:hypothetical protein
MATAFEVRQYLAYWFQLGKPVWLRGGAESLLPNPVMAVDRYSSAFEDCWNRVTAPESGDCYLEGASYTIAELLSPAWEINPCSRCTMPVPIRSVGIAELECPCVDVSGWPNTELPQPRAPISTQSSLNRIRDRLQRRNPA